MSQHAAPRHLRATGPLASLIERPYRRYVTGFFCSSTALSVASVARVWLVQQKTDSPFFVSLVPALLMAPMLFLSVPGGELADRFSRKAITIGYESFALAIYVVTAVLVWTGSAGALDILVATVLQGIGAAVTAPARQTFVTDLVHRRQQRGALGFFLTVANASSIAGPAVGGALIARFGLQYAFVSAAVFAAPALPLYLSLKPVRKESHGMHRGGMLKNLREGLRYVAGDASLKWLLMACLVMIVTVNAWGALFPAFAEDVLDVGAGGLGVLGMVVGIGAVLATFVVVAAAGRIPDKTVEVVSGFMFAAFVLGMAASTIYPLTVLIVTLAAFAATVFFQTNLTAVQLHAPEEYRGRVLSIRFVAWGLQPVGLLALGGLAEVIGPQLALAAFSAVGAGVFLVLVLVLRPHHVRRVAELEKAGPRGRHRLLRRREGFTYVAGARPPAE